MSRTLLLTLLVVATAAHADFKAAYVDIQRAMQETAEGRAAKTRLTALASEKEKAFDKEQAALKAEVDAFKKQSSTMPDDARRKREDELQKKTYDFAQQTEKLRAELAELDRKELATIFPKLEALLGQLAQRDGLTMVFDRSSSGLAWAPPSLDLTNELIRAYDTTYPYKPKADGKPDAKADPKADPKAPAPAPKAPAPEAPKK